MLKMEFLRRLFLNRAKNISEKETEEFNMLEIAQYKSLFVARKTRLLTLIVLLSFSVLDTIVNLTLKEEQTKTSMPIKIVYSIILMLQLFLLFLGLSKSDPYESIKVGYYCMILDFTFLVPLLIPYFEIYKLQLSTETIEMLIDSLKPLEYALTDLERCFTFILPYLFLDRMVENTLQDLSDLSEIYLKIYKLFYLISFPVKLLIISLSLNIASIFLIDSSAFYKFIVYFDILLFASFTIFKLLFPKNKAVVYGADFLFYATFLYLFSSFPEIRTFLVFFLSIIWGSFKFRVLSQDFTVYLIEQHPEYDNIEDSPTRQNNIELTIR